MYKFKVIPCDFEKINWIKKSNILYTDKYVLLNERKIFKKTICINFIKVSMLNYYKSKI